MTKLLFLAGSSRKESINKKLARYAAERAKEKGADVTFIDLADFDMPIYNGDIEDASGLPEAAIRLKKLFWEHDGFFIASPEYNSSFSPLLKNALDWISRKHSDDEAPLSAYRGKVAALGAVSMGALGGLRGLVPLRMMLSNIAVQVIPTQIAVGGMNTWTEDDKLAQEAHQKMLDGVLDEFIATTKALHA